jgi:AcrR family transcriptional regulator
VSGRPRKASSIQSKEKKEYHHGRLRQALIDAAVEVIASAGIDALNLRELATRVGVTAGAPYHHFANRGELLAAIAEEGFEKFTAALIAERDAAPDDAASRLEALGRGYLSFAISHPGHFRVMFHGDAKASGPTQSGLGALRLLQEAVQDCQRTGIAPPGEPTPLVLTAWSIVHGLATLWVDGALPFEGMDPEQLAPQIANMVPRMFAAMAASRL